MGEQIDWHIQGFLPERMTDEDDISARQHRPWQLYNEETLAHEYKVADRLLLGSDFPVPTLAGAIKRFCAINDFGAGAQVPPIPEDLIEAIMYERPLSMLDVESAVA